MAREAARLEQLAHHRLSFSAEALETGKGLCLDCGAQVTLEEWARESCPKEDGDASTAR